MLRLQISSGVVYSSSNAKEVVPKVSEKKLANSGNIWSKIEITFLLVSEILSTK